MVKVTVSFEIVIIIVISFRGKKEIEELKTKFQNDTHIQLEIEELKMKFQNVTLFMYFLTPF